ncbi:MAG TPA: phosphatase PAP2 family protein, partial [Thermoplasmata archaeon]|nr:phosphatase PAP2 family protein [Thermoplasmata archaeon]
MAGGGNLFLYGAGSNPFLDAAALLLDISALLYLMVLWAAPLWASKRRALASDFLVALLVTVLITEVLKFVIGARRPAEDYPGLYVLRPALFPDLSDPSFPSGHTSRAFVFAAVLGL